MSCCSLKKIRLRARPPGRCVFCAMSINFPASKNYAQKDAGGPGNFRACIPGRSCYFTFCVRIFSDRKKDIVLAGANDFAHINALVGAEFYVAYRYFYRLCAALQQVPYSFDDIGGYWFRYYAYCGIGVEGDFEF